MPAGDYEEWLNQLLAPGTPPDRYRQFHRCERCQVSWTGDEPCWVCGR